MENKRKIILVDMGHFVHKSIYSKNAMLKRKQEFIDNGQIEQAEKMFIPNATYIMMTMLIGNLKKIGINPDTEDRVILAYDSRDNWRKKLIKEYKGNRDEIRSKASFVDWSKEYEYMNRFMEKLERGTPFFQVKIPTLEADDIIACFSPETYIASPVKTGENKQIKHIKKGDKVYSYNIKEKKVEISIVKKTSKRHVSERYILYFDNNMRLKVTAEHPLYTVKHGWKKVKDIKIGDEIYYLNSTQKNKYVLLNHKRNSHNYYRIGYLCGAIESDGHFDNKRNRIQFNINDKDFVERIRIYLKILFNYEMVFTKIDSTYRILIGNKLIYNTLKEYCLKREKLPKHFKRGFVAGFYDGEGNMYEDGHVKRIQMSNTNKKLIKYVENILKKEFNFKLTKRFQYKKPLYLLTSIHPNDIKFFTFFRPAIHRKYPKYLDTRKYLANGKKVVRIEKQNHHKGYNVYNLTVEPNNNYFANNLLVHNCSTMFYKDELCIILSEDHDFDQLLTRDNVKIFSPNSKVKNYPYRILDINRDIEKKKAYKSLMKKIRKESADNLMTEVSNEQEYDKRELVVKLIDLPKFVTEKVFKVLQQIETINKDEYDLSVFALSISNRFFDIFKPDKVISYEKCLKKIQKKSKKKKEVKKK